MTAIAQRVVTEATIIRQRDEHLRLRTRAIRVCIACRKVMGEPRTEAEYNSDLDVCGSDCWQRVKRGQY